MSEPFTSYGPDFPYAEDVQPGYEPGRVIEEPTPQRPPDLIVRPPSKGSSINNYYPNPEAEIPAHWAWFGGKPKEET